MMGFALYNLDYLNGPYSELSDVSAVKRYVYAAQQIDETSEFPNLIYKGWCTRGGEKWQADFCPWSARMYDEWFGTWVVGRLRFLRWRIGRGEYVDDMTRWRP